MSFLIRRTKYRFRSRSYQQTELRERGYYQCRPIRGHFFREADTTNLNYSPKICVRHNNYDWSSASKGTHFGAVPGSDTLKMYRNNDDPANRQVTGFAVIGASGVGTKWINVPVVVCGLKNCLYFAGRGSTFFLRKIIVLARSNSGGRFPQELPVKPLTKYDW